MLRLVINPGGTARTVKIVEALLLLGVDISQPSHRPETTPEEMHRRRRERDRESMQRMLERERAA